MTEERAWFAKALRPSSEEEFEQALQKLERREIVLPERFPPERRGDASHTPVTMAVTYGARGEQNTQRMVRLLHEKLGFSVNDCTIPGELSPLAICIEEADRGRLEVARYLLLECNAQIPALRPTMQLSMKLMDNAAMLELFAQRPPPAIVAEMRELRYDFRCNFGHNLRLLHVAVSDLNPRAVELLVRCFKVDTEVYDECGRKPEQCVDEALASHSVPYAEFPPDGTWAERADAIRLFFAEWSEQRELAFLMGHHHRLGGASEVRHLPIELFRKYIQKENKAMKAEHDDDVVFEDDDVCILRPDADRGIVIFHRFPPDAADAIAREGLVLGSGARKQHSCHFFRAPAYYHGDQRAHPSAAEVSENYPYALPPDTFCIRIDPNKTAAFMSEARAVYYGTRLVRESRRMLPDFWQLIQDNAHSGGNRYHVISGMKGYGTSEDWVQAPPERNAEVLVACHVIPPAWRVTVKN